ncbi:hypothetical protein RYX36_026582 [Vicia faba]
MEGMVTDLTLAKENQTSFEEYLNNNPNANPGIDLTVTVLTTGFWPSYKSFDLNLPAEMVNYFFEAFESFNALEDPKAVFSLKYMLLCKIMVSQADDVAGIISSKAGLQYVGPDLDAMKAVADAHSKRSLK